MHACSPKGFYHTCVRGISNTGNSPLLSNFLQEYDQETKDYEVDRHAVFWSDDGCKSLYKNHLRCTMHPLKLSHLWSLGVMHEMWSANRSNSPGQLLTRHFNCCMQQDACGAHELDQRAQVPR